MQADMIVDKVPFNTASNYVNMVHFLVIDYEENLLRKFSILHWVIDRKTQAINIKNSLWMIPYNVSVFNLTK